MLNINKTAVSWLRQRLRFGWSLRTSVCKVFALSALTFNAQVVCAVDAANPQQVVLTATLPTAAQLKAGGPVLDPLLYVNPLIATGGHGHAFPGAVVPFGMVQLSPDNISEGWDWTGGYHYSSDRTVGFSHTHLSGTGVGDLLDILVLPFHGDYAAELAGAAAPHQQAVAAKRSNSAFAQISRRYSHSDEVAQAGYYALGLPDDGIRAELTATERVGVHRYQFSQAKAAQVLLDLGYAQNFDKAVVGYLRQTDPYTLVGYRVSTGWAKLQPLHFVARFDKPFTLQLYQDGKAVPGHLLQASHSAAVLNFGALAGQQLQAAVALSYVSIEGAQANLAAELPGAEAAEGKAPQLDFAAVKTAAQQRWRDLLSRFTVQVDAELPSASSDTLYLLSTSNAARLTKFYTALYHSHLAPQLFSDVDGRYFAADGSIRQTAASTPATTSVISAATGHSTQPATRPVTVHQPHYTLYSLWDTFRGLHPLLTITQPGRVDDMMQSMYRFYQANSVLPSWDLMSNETDVMIGYHAVPVLADAYFKGLTRLTARQLLDAALASARQRRFGIDLLARYGYVPSDLEVEAVSKTLEYAFDDHAIARLAQAAGDKAVAAEFTARASAYRHLFDASTGFMRGKTAKGDWVSPFNPLYVDHRVTDYTEANAWQYSFFVPHQVDELIALYGGAKPFVARLNQMFSMSSHMDGNVSPDITGLIGQYAHGNEPVHHVPYLFALAGQPADGERWIRHIRDSMYRAAPDGLAGNDDLGQLSAWYVLSSLGFYPVNPVDSGYVRGVPEFRHIRLQLEHGKQLNIRIDGPMPGLAGQRDKAVAVQRWTFNGQPLGITFSHQQLQQGGELVFYTR